MKHYLQIILDRKNDLQELSKSILVDAYFYSSSYLFFKGIRDVLRNSKENFVNPLLNEGFTVISRLRDDADLRYIFTGEQKKGRGRPKIHDGKIDFKNLDLSKLKKVSSQEKEEIYIGIVFSKSLKWNINLVIVKTKNNSPEPCCCLVHFNNSKNPSFEFLKLLLLPNLWF